MSKRSRELDERLRVFQQAGATQAAWLLKRWDELSLVYGDSRAYERASVEQFCEWKLFLPLRGLKSIQVDLEERGFYLQEYNDLLAGALFPDNWGLMPSDEFPEDPEQVRFAYLLAPDESKFARIFYRADYDSGAAIWRYKG